MFSHSSCLGEASAGRVGPLARGTFDCLSRDPALPGAPSSRRRGVGREEPPPGAPPRPPRCSPRSRLPWPGRPGSQRVIHRVWAHAACVADAAHPPRCQSFFHSLGEGLSRRAGPRALLPSHSSWSGPLRGHRALPLSPVFRVTSEQTSMWLVWGWENFTNIRT